MRRAAAQDGEWEALERRRDQASAEVLRLRQEAREVQADVSATLREIRTRQKEATERAAASDALERENRRLRIDASLAEEANAALASRRGASRAEETEARTRLVLEEAARARVAQELEDLGADMEENLGNVSQLAGDVSQLKERLSHPASERTAVREAIQELEAEVESHLEANARSATEASELEERVLARERQTFQLILQIRSLEQDRHSANQTKEALESENDRLRDNIREIDRICRH